METTAVELRAGEICHENPGSREGLFRVSLYPCFVWVSSSGCQMRSGIRKAFFDVPELL